ncbi:MAG: hypothetical protein II262_05760 [Alistipes sp.]|nr:hypothetical protein [Alistipes sp.]
MNTEIDTIVENLDQKRHSDSYYFEYHFIPMMVEGVKQGEFAPEALLETENWQKFIKEHIDPDFIYNWEELHCQGAQLNQTTVMALYIFPEPEQMPLAAFGAVIVDIETNSATYYTLEKSVDDSWVLGSMSSESHRNFGSVDCADLEKFIEWVFEQEDIEVSLGVDDEKLPS